MKFSRWTVSLGIVIFISIAQQACMSEPIDCSAAIFSTLKSSKIGLGSGCFIANDGTLLTAYHVIQDASDIEVDYQGKAYKDVVVLRWAPAQDLAILQVHALLDVPTSTPVATSPISLTAGESAFAYGNSARIFKQAVPAIISRPSIYTKEIRDPVTHEYIFATRNVVLIPLTMTIFNGLSGAPLVVNGQVIGVISGSLTEGGSIAWAMPVSDENINTMEMIGKPAKDITWPPLSLMMPDWHGLRAEISISEELAHALDTFSDSVEQLYGAASDLDSRCGQLRQQLEASLAGMKQLLADSPDRTLSSLTASQVQMDLRNPIQFVNPCEAAMKQVLSIAPSLHPELASVVSAFGDYLKTLPHTDHNRDLVQQVVNGSQQAKSMLQDVAPKFSGLAMTLSTPGSSPGTHLSDWQSFYSELHDRISRIAPAENAHSPVLELAVALRQVDLFLEPLFKADQAPANQDN